MSVTSAPIVPHVQTSLDLWDALTAGRPRDFALRLWDGTTVGPDPGRPARFTVALAHPGSLRRMFAPLRPSLALGEAYIFGDFDVEGDIIAYIGLLRGLAVRRRTVGENLRLLRLILALPAVGRPRGERGANLSGRAHTVERDRQAISYHYD